MTTRRRLVLALAAGAGAGPAAAAIHWRVPPYLPDRSPEFVQRMAAGLVADLRQRQAMCALVFRAGLRRADMPAETAYTHGAIWLSRALAPSLAPGDDPADPTDAYVVFGLFTGDGHDVPRSRSVLRVERPTDFMRRSIEDDVGVVIPTAPMQDRLATIVASPTYEAMRLPRYSVLANPLRRKFQNCDVFLLYLVGAAAWQTDDPEAVRAHLVAADFQPTLIRTPGVLDLLAPLFDDRVSMADQSGEVRTASWESIRRFMLGQGLASDAYVFRDPAL
jgi:hypothetical protein